MRMCLGQRMEARKYGTENNEKSSLTVVQGMDKLENL